MPSRLRPVPRVAAVNLTSTTRLACCCAVSALSTGQFS